MARTLHQPFYLITDGGKLRHQKRLLNQVELALGAADGLIGAVQLREQVIGHEFAPATDRELCELAVKLKELCLSFGATAIINSRLDIASVAAINAVHLGKRSVSLVDAREMLGADATLGYSAHSVSEANAASSAGASYVFLSSVFTSPSKSMQSSAVIGIDALNELCSSTDGIVYALGGINASNIGSCRRAGASGVAVISSVFSAADPAKAIRSLTKAW